MPSACKVAPTFNPINSRRPKNCKVTPPVSSQISTSRTGAEFCGATRIAVTRPTTRARLRQVILPIFTEFFQHQKE